MYCDSFRCRVLLLAGVRVQLTGSALSWLLAMLLLLAGLQDKLLPRGLAAASSSTALQEPLLLSGCHTFFWSTCSRELLHMLLLIIMLC
jgi:hypothetical protein